MREHVGLDGQWFIERLEEAETPAVIQTLPEVQVLKTVWGQQFQETGEKVVYQAATTYDRHAQVHFRLTDEACARCAWRQW